MYVVVRMYDAEEESARHADVMEGEENQRHDWRYDERRISC